MKPVKTPTALNRRGFLKAGAGVLAAGATASAAPAKKSNPYEYKVDHLFKTDAKLIQYEQAGRYPVPGKNARRVVIGPEDAICLAAGNQVFGLDKNLNRRFESDLGQPVRCLAMAANGVVYAGLREEIVRLDAAGKPQQSWKISAAKTWLTGLAVAENDVFAADAGNRVVLRFDPAGKLLGRIGEKNAARNIPGLICPSPFLDVEIARDGLLRVTNPGRHLVEAYTFDGDREFAWGKPTMGIEGFCGCCNPINIALLPDGRVVTCEKGLPRVKVYSAKGEFECVVAGPESFPESLRTGAGLGKSDGSMAGMDAAVRRLSGNDSGPATTHSNSPFAE